MNIFYNYDEDRFKAGWRILLQLLLFMLLVWPALALKNFLIDTRIELFQSIALGLAGLGSVWIAAITLDRRPMRAYGIGWNKAFRSELAGGLLIGGLPMALIFGVHWASGGLTVTGYGWERASAIPYALWLGSYLLSMCIIGFYEELIFRGYQILNLVEGLSIPLLSPARAAAMAVLISSAVFGVLHAGNPNASAFSTINIIIAGAVLAIPYLITGRLAVSIGMHISWNFMQGGIFGLPVSGTFYRGSLIQVRQEGPAWLTGGSFGPEAGLTGLLGILLMALLFYGFLAWRKETFALKLGSKYSSLNSAKVDE